MITNLTSYTNLAFRLLRDDGAIIYLNGNELYRDVMPTGAVTYQTFAADAVASTSETTYYATNIAPGWLVEGTNVLAVEIHQCDLTSSDLSFDLELVGQYVPAGNAPPACTLATPAGGQYAWISTAFHLTATASDAGGSVTSVEFFDGTDRISQQSAPPFVVDWASSTPGNHYLTAVATDNLGARGTSAVVVVTLLPVSEPWPFVINTGAVWKYLDTGTYPGTNWMAPSFNDVLWKSGPAELGYGDSGTSHPETTVIEYGPDGDNKHITTYFRHTFSVTNAAKYTNLFARMRIDDAAIVYVNGSEVFRFNLPLGSISHTNRAKYAIAGDEEWTCFWSHPLDPACLREGSNVIAVEVHQDQPSSSDLSFDLGLVGNWEIAAEPYPLAAGQRGWVRCLMDPDHVYEIYLPPAYSATGQPLPVLYTYNPTGSGMVGDFQSVASSLQIIVVGVTKMQNGMTHETFVDQVYAVRRDLQKRVLFDPTAEYAAGLSGGGMASYGHARDRGPHLAGVLSMCGWLGRMTNAYSSLDRVTTNLLVARTTGNSDTGALSYLAPDAAVLESYGAVIRDWYFAGGHEVAPDSIKYDALYWLVNQRIKPGPADRANSAVWAAEQRGRLAAGELEGVVRTCVNSLRTKPRTWEAFQAEQLLDEAQAQGGRFAPLNWSGLASDGQTLDYLYFRACAQGRNADWNEYLSSLKLITGVEVLQGSRVGDIIARQREYGLPAACLLGVQKIAPGGIELIFRHDSVGLKTTVMGRFTLEHESAALNYYQPASIGNGCWRVVIPIRPVPGEFFGLRTAPGL